MSAAEERQFLEHGYVCGALLELRYVSLEFTERIRRSRGLSLSDHYFKAIGNGQNQGRT